MPRAVKLTAAHATLQKEPMAPNGSACHALPKDTMVPNVRERLRTETHIPLVFQSVPELALSVPLLSRFKARARIPPGHVLCLWVRGFAGFDQKVEKS